MRESQYFWIVRCKNHSFHHRQNLFFEHKIPLAETDAVLPPPNLKDRLWVRCDECGREYSYGPEEILRAQLDPPESFQPHPMFL